MLASAVLAHEHAGQLPRGPMLIYVCCAQHAFLCLNTDFVGSANIITTRYIFNFIDIYSYIPVSGCVGMGTSALLCPGAYKMALL